MRRKLGLLASLALIAATAPATALAGSVFLAVGGIFGDVSFEGDTFAENNVPSDNIWGFQGAVGFRFDSKLVIEGRLTSGISLDILTGGDSFMLSDERVAVGYAFQPNERFSVIPSVGVSFWDLDTQDGPGILFLGSERADFDSSGSDPIWRVSGEWRYAQRWSFCAAYSRGHYSFGESSGLSFETKFQFR
jgi:hypothetical protein